jgi:hypothetical protein
VRGRRYPLKPIETAYRGVIFRSRLEARWALFFDWLKVRWFYEFEGFRLPSGNYVPDFWLPDVKKTWVEIKPDEPTKDEAIKCGEFATATGNRVVCFGGEPGFWMPDPYAIDIEGRAQCFTE